MDTKRLPDRIGALAAIGVGAIVVVEAYRLYPLRLTQYSGDHILLGLLGGLMILLGLLLLFVIRPPAEEHPFPKGQVLKVFLATILILILYRILMPYLGYTLITLAASVGLFKLLGSYKWLPSVGMGVAITACFYGVFVYWLQMSIPRGILGF